MLHTPRRFDRKDLLVLGIIILAFAPIYLFSLHNIPWQVNTDEVAISRFSEQTATAGVNPFGILPDYFGFPAMPFFVFGKLAIAMGGVTLAHMRLIHALSGLLIIAVAYLFFRELIERREAILATVILGINHSLIAISRMAMRDNTGLLLELGALTLLLIGLRRKSKLISFLGGIVTALTFYTYYPSRITLILWILFLIAGILFFRKTFHFKQVVSSLSIALIGFVLMVIPIGIASIHGVSNLNYPKQQFLFLPEGQALQVEWSGGKPVSEAIKENIINGLTTFNAPIVDHGFIYPNFGHGFVDPLTGALLWIGITIALLRLLSRDESHRTGDLLSLIGFGSLYLAFAFLITKAPNYTRLLVILPFVAYLGTIGASWVAELLASFSKHGSKILRIGLLILVGMAIVLLNATIFDAFILKGLREGNDVGSTGRYAETRNEISGYAFYIAANDTYPYYSWGNKYQWHDWLQFFAGNKKVEVISPEKITSHFDPPFTIFMNKALWHENKTTLQTNYPKLEITDMEKDGMLVAVEVRSL